jgi:hypothetical protein
MSMTPKTSSLLLSSTEAGAASVRRLSPISRVSPSVVLLDDVWDVAVAQRMTCALAGLRRLPYALSWGVLLMLAKSSKHDGWQAGYNGAT